jgi:endonuclease III
VRCEKRMNIDPVKTLQTLSRLYPHDGALHVGMPYHMVVMVALSARTRDEQILKLAPRFFNAFPTVQSLAAASIADIVDRIDTIGMYKQKAQNLSRMARAIVDEFGGEVPTTMENLVRLPGVGRKTASVLLAATFDTPAIAVDTHVYRVVNRLGWVKTRTVEATERALLKMVPESMQHIVNRVFVPFGRTICVATPRCWACPLVNECAFAKKNLVPPPNAPSILAAIQKSHEGIRTLKERLRTFLEG